MAKQPTYQLNELPKSLAGQRCVQSVIANVKNIQLREEMLKFMKRNTLPDCGKVPPNCLKAHLIRTAKKVGVSKKRIAQLKTIFKSKIGFNGYYLDKGKLMSA